jgi:glycosyltransferase involved in cell wall biosynthesis
MQIEVTALILTFNEAPNIARTVNALSWLPEVVVVDSGSIDQTPELAQASHPDVRIVTRPFDTHANQWNFGLAQIRTPWVLTLDADYEVSAGLAQEILKLSPDGEVAGYEAQFGYRINGRPLRSSVYPPRIVLFRTDRATYFDDGHTQRLRIDGSVKSLSGLIYHDDRKSFSRWLQEQKRYATIEARHLMQMCRKRGAGGKEQASRSGEQEARSKERGARSGELATASSSIGEQGAGTADQLSFQDRLRLKIFFAAPAMFFYLLFVRGLILDGWRGWVYVAQRTIAELLLSYRVLIEKLSNRG